jgi:hypothetical protein
MESGNDYKHDDDIDDIDDDESVVVDGWMLI